MRTGFLKGILAASALSFYLPVQAEDIDLFVGTTPSANDVPNVLVVLDNTANWNNAFTNEMAALSTVLSGLDANKFRLGLMMFTETGQGNSNTDGAYVRAAIRLLDSSNKTKYQQLVQSLHITDDKSNGGKVGLAMWEAYQYFSAGAPHAGNGKKKTDYSGNATGTTASNAVYALAGNALAAKGATAYNTPIASGCAKNFIIYISNGAAQDNNADTTAGKSALAAAGGRTTTIPISPSGSQDNVADEWARFMKSSDLGIVTYTIDVNKVTTGQGPGWTALLKSMAGVSGGKYFDVTSTGSEIADALRTALSEIQSVNSAFASVSLPVSVNTQGTYLNQVFIGMFRPDEHLGPRWAGNLKQYKLGLSNGALRLQDAAGNSAINTSTNFITECARSFWTPTSLDTYWQNKPQGACLTVANSDISNTPDGNVVEKGGQGYLLRSGTSRTVYTCNPSFASCTQLTDFATTNTNITSSLLGVADAERTNLINWARGLDVNDEDQDLVTTEEKRQSAHGDVVHSRPVAIDYGTTGSPQVVVFYGGNDGVFRAINGNRTDSIGSVAAGGELWSFVPPEFYGKLSRLRTESPTIAFQGSTGGQPKSYGIDGPITAFRGTIDTTQKTYIYAGMRRGGRALYAFDVTTPASPSLKWKVGCPNLANDDGCSSQMSGIGQTWSSAVVLKAAGYGAGNSPMLIMGGGYDSCEDTDDGTVNHSCTSSSKGKKIYVLDANTGQVLKVLDTKRGVVGDITVVPDSSGLAKYAYAADVGGNVYRVTIGSGEPNDWTIARIASFGCADGGSCSSNRKFLFAPEVVVATDGYLLQIGSGDREKPLSSFPATARVANYFFNFKDRPTESGWLSTDGTCSADGENFICLNSLLAISGDSTPTQEQLNAKPKGWYLGLAASEQVVTSAITVFGRIVFNTHQPTPPDPNACSGLGTNRAYNIAYKDASGLDGDRFVVLDGGGLSPSPVAGKVRLDDGTELPFVCTLECFEPDPEFSAVTRPKGRVYWSIDRE
ncbi:pilus assembly protein [Pseudomonas sp. TCU-HL1]|uniref:pilus assembly protein n=1 Tax=Pseudomonas sp. TCU-HL1 TaxID=1856685 RepID=UPI00083CD776|nr:PilC/PilY family type IV pilus protein [Pseudomonas sp. TCU-HL1]AOE83530.1 type 4 fimbrial biogenesis PilY1 signal peptide [Pseudomonas sp. TCU-HL1]